MQDDRDNRLSRFNERLAEQIHDLTTRRRAALADSYFRAYEDELANAEFCLERGDYVNAMYHSIRAELYNNNLKSLKDTN
ncbi:MAG: hypothetical protein WBE68_11130 [Candidatus Nitrosopolaris sp.]